MKSEKTYEDDDGRVICDMDVAGMPWHDRRAKRAPKAAHSTLRGEAITESETRRYVWHSILAGLTVVGVFSATWVLFILFCIFVWFK